MNMNHALLALDQIDLDAKIIRRVSRVNPTSLFNVFCGRKQIEARVADRIGAPGFRITHHCLMTGVTLPGMRVTTDFDHACNIAREIVS